MNTAIYFYNLKEKYFDIKEQSFIIMGGGWLHQGCDTRVPEKPMTLYIVHPR